MLFFIFQVPRVIYMLPNTYAVRYKYLEVKLNLIVTIQHHSLKLLKRRHQEWIIHNVHKLQHVGSSSAVPATVCVLRTWCPFHKYVFIVIQIRLKFRFALTSISTKWSLQNSAHDTLVALSWHVQKLVVIWWPVTELQRGKFPIKFQLWAKIVSEMGSRGSAGVSDDQWT